MRSCSSRLLGLYVALLCTLGCLPTAGRAQALAGDRILGIVDDEIILSSELDAQIDYLKKSGQKDDGTLRCTVLEEVLVGKVLLAKAKIDSLEVSDDQVDAEVERRLSTMERQLGSREAIEEVAGKSYLQFKLGLRPQIKDQLLAQNMRNKIYNDATITPNEVKDYYRSIPRDSLPYLPAELELAQIIIKPVPSDESKQRTRERLQTFRNMVLVEGEPFESVARAFSEDPGSRNNGGMLPRFCRGDMVPQFEEVAYGLSPGEVSEIFESPFGFHIIKLEKRIGNCIDARHILLSPRIESVDEQKAKARIEELRQRILTEDTLSFTKAAVQYSEDRQSKDVGGRLRSRSGEYRIPMEQLESDVFLEIDRLKPGEISKPIEFIDKQGIQVQKAYKLIYLIRRYAPHEATLEQDYQKFHGAALTAKQNEILEGWLKKVRGEVYIELRDEACSQALTNWVRP